MKEIINQEEAIKILKFLKNQKEIGVNLGISNNRQQNSQWQGILIWANNQVFHFPSFLLLKPILENEEIKKFGYNLKFIWKVLAQRGIKIKGLDFDLLIADYILNPGERNYSLEKIIFRELKEKMSFDLSKKESAGKILDWSAKAVPFLKQRIKETKLEKVFYEIEMPLISVLAAMELAGVKIDKSQFLQLSSDLKKKIKILEQKIYDLVGMTFNLNSPRQLSEILFKKLKLETKGIKKTPKGEISTQASELLKLRHFHPLIDLILEFRELTKLKNTYVDVLPNLIDSQTHRIHTFFNQTGTTTGRLASDSPNLQNIPQKGEWGKRIRRAFIAEPGYSLVSFDYSQIELRIAASLAQDKKMIDIFNRGGDIHKMTAAEINNISPENVTSEMRQTAKTLNFGVLYGMSARSFSEAAGISLPQAQKFIEEYFQDFQGIRNYLEKTKRFVYDNGFVETLTGRRRYLPEIHSPNFQIRSEAERMAINMPIQGLAADIIKMAMIKIDKTFSSYFDSGDLKMILQVHDELVFEVKNDIIKKIAFKIKEIMETVFKLAVPIIVEIKIGDNWGEMKDFKI